MPASNRFVNIYFAIVILCQLLTELLLVCHLFRLNRRLSINSKSLKSILRAWRTISIIISTILCPQAIISFFNVNLMNLGRISSIISFRNSATYIDSSISKECRTSLVEKTLPKLYRLQRETRRGVPQKNNRSPRTVLQTKPGANLIINSEFQIIEHNTLFDISQAYSLPDLINI